MDDDLVASTIAARLGVLAVTSTYSGDWYGENDGWADDLPDYSKD